MLSSTSLVRSSRPASVTSPVAMVAPVALVVPVALLALVALVALMALVALCATYPVMQLMQLKLQGLGEGGGAGDKEKHLAVRDLSRHGGVQLHLNEGRIVYCAHILSNTPHILQLPRRTCVLLHRGMQLSSLFYSPLIASIVRREFVSPPP